MVAPTTQFEDTAGAQWTSLANETAFLTQVAAETDLSMATAGTSVEGRPIHRLELGDNPDRTMFITSLIHASEPASREALLMFLRDWAYTTDPAKLAYLADHRIVALTPCNPDSQAIRKRENANNVNINRDFYRLTQPETRAIMAAKADVQPDFSLDIHEHSGGFGLDWVGRGGGNPIVVPQVTTWQDSCFDACEAAVDLAGYSTGVYPWLNTMRAGMSTVAGPTHTVGMLSETDISYTPTERASIQRLVLDAARDWHELHADDCAAATAASRLAATSTNAPLPLYTHEYLGQDPTPPMIDVAGYQLATPMPADHVNAFGIVVDGTGFVTMRQEAQWVIPTLCDPLSTDKVVTATRVAKPDPLPNTALLALKVHTGQHGVREVIRIRHHDGTRVRDIRLP